MASLLPDSRLWIHPERAQPQTRLFRRRIDLPGAPPRAELRVLAESVYHVWLNGAYLGRGPAQHHPHRLPVDRYNLAGRLRPGANVIAVLVHTPGIALHNHVPRGEPGLTARLEIEHADGRIQVIDSDTQWRITDQTGWCPAVPRRSWAIGHIEYFDNARAPHDWQAIAFDDSGWLTPDVHQPLTRFDDCQLIERPVPPLRYRFHSAPPPVSAFTITDPPRPISPADSTAATGQAIMAADWSPLAVAGIAGPAQHAHAQHDHVQHGDAQHTAGDGMRAIAPSDIRIEPIGDGFVLRNLAPERGVILCFDLGAEYVGQVVFDAVCPTAGVIDVGWSEVMENGRPLLVRKGVSYCDRILATPGAVHWHPIGYSGMRYLLLVLRGFTGEMRFNRFGVIASEPDLDWSPRLSTADPELEAVAGLCQRTIRIGTQEGPMDCPTREQATYIGDGQLICRWIAMLTGDARYWATLVDDQFARPSPQGLLRSAVYSGSNDTLIDYSLLAVIGLRDYWRYTVDAPRVQRWIDCCRRVLGFFDTLRDERDLLAFNWQRPAGRAWEQCYDPALPDFASQQQLNLFIDHPGMGWHNQGEAGIDRRGSNTALTALDVLARRALADLESALGEDDRAQRLREQAERFAAAIHRHCFDPARGFYVDGLLDGQQLAQVSEQTNTWAIAARCCEDAVARDLLHRLLTAGDPGIARNGPYFWAYLFPELARLGLHALGLAQLPRWRQMIDGGATTLWETFVGDDLDTWCHPWSAAPLEFLLTAIAGLPAPHAAEPELVLHPRPDLLAACTATAHTRHGLVHITWKRSADTLEFAGTIPAGQRARLILPSGTTFDIEGTWQRRMRE